jgi:dsRNA-specific ribonuclease
VVNGERRGVGHGSSRQRAEEAAALIALDTLGELVSQPSGEPG